MVFLVNFIRFFVCKITHSLYINNINTNNSTKNYSLVKTIYRLIDKVHIRVQVPDPVTFFTDKLYKDRVEELFLYAEGYFLHGMNHCFLWVFTVTDNLSLCVHTKFVKKQIYICYICDNRIFYCLPSWALS